MHCLAVRATARPSFSRRTLRSPHRFNLCRSSMSTNSTAKEIPTFQFGDKRPRTSQVFFRSKLCLGFVNIKPVVPGHVLVIPKRCVPRYKDLTLDEITDMWLSVQIIGPVIEKLHNAKALTLVIQDGKDAGQTVPHVHVHIMPRRPGDFPRNDEIYDRLDVIDSIPPRTEEEMEIEAKQLIELFPDHQHHSIELE